MSGQGLEHFDLYQIHYPNNSVPIEETMRAMEALVDSGKVKYIGVSNFSVDELREAQVAMTRHPVVSNQVIYNLKRRGIESDLLPYCEENDVTVVAYTPLADGSLTKGSGLWGGRGTQTLERIAAEVDKTPAQVALNWCTSRPGVVTIPKSNSVARTEENCRASGWRLSPEQIRLLDEAFPL